jgi:hypothetical protein
MSDFLFFKIIFRPFISFSKPGRPLVFLIKFSKENPEINQSINQRLFCYETLKNNPPLSPSPPQRMFL